MKSQAEQALANPSSREVPMQPASLDIWDKKYRLKTRTEEVLDQTLDDTWKRIARALADVEATPELREKWYGKFLWALRQGAIPAGRIIANAGAWEHKPATSTINCTVSGTIHDSMDDILQKLHEAGLTLKAGSGIGYDFSTLRPRGAYVSGAGAYTSGPLSFMDIYDKMCFTVSSAGGRRGAQMGTFDIGHPDVVDFIRAKRADGSLRQFNLSLLITADFMQAVKDDAEWPLAFPMTLQEAEQDGIDLDDPAQVLWRDWPDPADYITNNDGLVACRIYRRLPARKLWNVVMTSTYDYAEPGFVLIDKVNEMNNNWWCEQIRATNPCGEQPLPPYGACWTGDMRLNTNFGLIRTEDAFALVQQGEALKVAVDDVFSGQKTDLRPCTLVENGTREVFEVRFDNGQRIELTADHQVYTPDGWRRVDQLDVGSLVHVQARELSHLSLADPFYLGALKYLLQTYTGDQLMVTRQSRRALLRTLLDQLKVNYQESPKGLQLSRYHPLMEEIDRLDLSLAPLRAVEGYVHAAQLTAGRYKDKPAAYGERVVCEALAEAIKRLTHEPVRISRHRKETYRVLLPDLALQMPTMDRYALDLEYATYGWLLADGWLTHSAGVLFSDQDDVAMETIAPQFAAMTGTSGTLRQAYAGQARNVYSLACYRASAIENLKSNLGLEDYRSRQVRVPERIWRADSARQASFLTAVFCADGSIDTEKLNIRLTSASREWLQDIQLLLLNFGIHGTIMASVSRGNAFYTLCLQHQDAYRFYRYIGFLFNTTKQEKLESLLAGKERWRAPKEDHVARIEAITAMGEQTVYDIEEYSTHTLVVNGVVVHNCLLGSINLTKFVREPFTAKARFDWEQFRETVAVFTRMLDNVVEINGLPLPQQREEIIRKRRHGMGYLGLGSAITMMGMKYGEERSLRFTEDVTREMALSGWRTGLSLAREKGPAPIMEEEFEVTPTLMRLRPEMEQDGIKVGDRIKGKVLHARYSRYMQQVAQVDPELVKSLAAQGCRFTHHTSIAPTGTISLSLANNASNGIEPSFAHHYARNVIRSGKKTKEKVDVYSFELLAYRHLVNPEAMPYAEDPKAQLPEYFITADEIDPKAHVDVQAAAQRWIDSSISKTINVPTAHLFDDFKDIYMYAYEQGLKGCTTFRFNPEAFQGVLVKEKDLENTTYRFVLEDGSVVLAKGNEEIEYDGETHNAANLYDALKEGYYGKF
ncbi:ribonucleoside-diphosphate reductase [Ectothiorhodospira shaposhnikovii]|uniref:LAGLIDADG family homing endonuclease n=1 Tax=Ectothiorhodospira shaposhnikovii TaxID=1054 RepID=UPI0019061834|nr:LAGLIDADG family homing endonuclease [Ectothiorhodospira shaposhnikovii]MBK1674450.1 ribonucleoside-diphosphate reductase [Ectothiorhodospira shaposhnikovii]